METIFTPPTLRTLLKKKIKSYLGFWLIWYSYDISCGVISLSFEIFVGGNTIIKCYANGGEIIFECKKSKLAQYKTFFVEIVDLLRQDEVYKNAQPKIITFAPNENEI